MSGVLSQLISVVGALLLSVAPYWAKWFFERQNKRPEDAVQKAAKD